MTKVKISEELSNYIERLHYDYNVSMNILRYLANHVENSESKLQDFFTQTKNIGIELELAKEEVVSEYYPDISSRPHRYTFDFRNKEIVFDGGDSCGKC